jgi:hypothetical protein
VPIFHSSCHCGNLQADLETDLRAEELALRACQCSFCSRHRARTVTDPSGRARIRVADPGLLSRYQWNLRSAEFLVCKRCGNYLGCAMRVGSGWVASLNANLFAQAAQLTQPAIEVSYDAETLEQRRRRRAQNWTPASWDDDQPGER